MSLSSQIRERVQEWRGNGYPGTSDTTARLLEYWFLEDHVSGAGLPLELWACQREAIETIIYLFEVAKLDSLVSMIRELNVAMRIDPREDRWPRYCLKMATGSGKTFVMALALVWQYFNTLRDPRNGYSNRFLLVGPNLIVLDRLLDAFEGGSIFQEYPLFIPDEWRRDFDLQVVRQSLEQPPQHTGILHCTNCQQLYDRKDESGGENPIGDQLPPPVRTNAATDSGVRLRDVLRRYDKLIVFNDEAHHAHTQTEWYDALRWLHEGGTRIQLQIDFTATAQDIAQNQQVTLPHVVYNYPLRRAIDDRIVKQPYLAYIEDAPPPLSENIVDRYRAEIELAINKLREKQRDLEPLDKKPVLFVVCESTNDADQVAEHIEDEYGFSDQEVLVIHTYVRSGPWGGVGDIMKDDLEAARQAAKTIDDNPVRVVSSVLMLQEGWDVRNVCVILPLRAFESDILVEQTLGRGLRRMFPNDPDAADELWVIEHPRFRELWRQKIQQEGLDIPETGPDSPPPSSHVIQVDPEKLAYDIEFPVLKGGLFSRKPRLREFDLSQLPGPPFSLEQVRPHDPKVVERELLERATLRRYSFHTNQITTFQAFVSYVTRSLLAESGGSQSQFAELAPMVKKFLLEHFDIGDGRNASDDVLKRLATRRVLAFMHDTFVPVLKGLAYDEQPYLAQKEFRVSDLEPVPTTLPVYSAMKTVFNLQPYPRDTSFELKFMQYLDGQSAVEAFAKIFGRLPLRIPYRDAETDAIRHYTPDFLIRTTSGLVLCETKGNIYGHDPNVSPKARAARRWCQAVRKETSTTIEYLYVPQELFETYRLGPWVDLLSAARDVTPFPPSGEPSQDDEGQAS